MKINLTKKEIICVLCALDNEWATDADMKVHFKIKKQLNGEIK